MRRTLLKTVSLSVMLALIVAGSPAWADDGGYNVNSNQGVTTPAVTPAPPPAESSLDAAGNISFTVGGSPSVKLAGQTTVCNANSKGAIRFNQATNMLEVCDGTVWKASSAGVGGGTTGGCLVSVAGYIYDRWGKGCISAAGVNIPACDTTGTPRPLGFLDTCPLAAATGYTCGLTSTFSPPQVFYQNSPMPYLSCTCALTQ